MNLPAAQPEGLPIQQEGLRLAVVGASRLLGKEVKQILDDRRIPLKSVHLLDDDEAMGQLTEFGGEPAIMETVVPNVFGNVDLVFFASSAAFTRRQWQAAQRAGCRMIDLSGALAGETDAAYWIPALDDILPPPKPIPGNLCLSPHPATIIVCHLMARLGRASPLARTALLFFEPVSERGQAALDELEEQTVNLLSFQPIPKEVFDSQVAFNLLPRYGKACAAKLTEIRARIEREANAYLSGRSALPAISLLHVPVFHSYAFEIFVEFSTEITSRNLEQKLESAVIAIRRSDEETPSPVGVAGESGIVLDFVRPDSHCKNSFWIFGTADNLRLAASNAVEIAERWYPAKRESSLSQRTRTA